MLGSGATRQGGKSGVLQALFAVWPDEVARARTFFSPRRGMAAGRSRGWAQLEAKQ